MHFLSLLAALLLVNSTSVCATIDNSAAAQQVQQASQPLSSA